MSSSSMQKARAAGSQLRACLLASLRACACCWALWPAPVCLPFHALILFRQRLPETIAVPSRTAPRRPPAVPLARRRPHAAGRAGRAPASVTSYNKQRESNMTSPCHAPACVSGYGTGFRPVPARPSSPFVSPQD